jgi:hypothetical protein
MSESKDTAIDPVAGSSPQPPPESSAAAAPPAVSEDVAGDGAPDVIDADASTYRKVESNFAGLTQPRTLLIWKRIRLSKMIRKS